MCNILQINQWKGGGLVVLTPPASHSHYSSLPSAKAVRVGLNTALGDEDIGYCPFSGSGARFGARIHYRKDSRTSLLTGRWTWIQQTF